VDPVEPATQPDHFGVGGDAELIGSVPGTWMLVRNLASVGAIKPWGGTPAPLCHSVWSHTIYDGCVDLLLLLPGTFSVVACDGCRLVRTWPQGSSHDLDPPLEPGQRLLDVGCGTGVRLVRAAQLGREAWGVEPDAHAAGMARSRPGVAEGRVIASTHEDAELPAATFQLITLSHVLEHGPERTTPSMVSGP